MNTLKKLQTISLVILVSIFGMFSVHAMENKDNKRKFNEISDQINNAPNKQQKISDEEMTDLLFDAIEKGDLEKVKTCIEDGSDINLKKDWTTPLTFAIDNYQSEIAIFLIRKKANINLQNDDLSTPLMHAINTNQSKVIELLIENEADLDLQNEDGFTALMFATSLSQLNTVQWLLNKNAAVDLVDEDGNTALMDSVVNFSALVNPSDDHLAIIKLLLTHNADFDLSEQTYRVTTNLNGTLRGLFTKINTYKTLTETTSMNYSSDILHNNITDDLLSYDKKTSLTPYEWLTLAFNNGNSGQIMVCSAEKSINNKDILHFKIQHEPRDLLNLINLGILSPMDTLNLIALNKDLPVRLVFPLLGKFNNKNDNVKNKMITLIKTGYANNNKNFVKCILTYKAINQLTNKKFPAEIINLIASYFEI